MKERKPLSYLTALLTLCLLTTAVSGCVVAPPDGGVRYRTGVTVREGYYDRDHHRWYHDNRWVNCDRRDVHCR